MMVRSAFQGSVARGVVFGLIAIGPMASAVLYPRDYRAGERYPLVIQSVYGGRIRDEFTLYGYQGGYGLGPAFVSPYVGRLLSARGIFVLHVNLTGDLNLKTPSEPRLRQQLFEAAAEQLISEGLVERNRVGLAGFSRNGFYVEYTLTHSTFAFAAALAADHWDASYTAQTLIGYDGGGADVNDGLPFDDALPRWLANAPGFGAQRVRTPLLQIEQSRGVLGVLLKWELFSRLRYLKKPVEFYVVRNAPFGVHNTQNPQQILDVQTRSIDWFTFWLQGTEDPDPAKQAQYERWRALRVLHEANMTSADRVAAPAVSSTSS